MLDPASRGVTSGQRGWPEVVESSNDVARLRRQGGGEEGANMWGPQVSDKGERRRCGRKA
jgi:hypothetical protein